MASNDVMLQRDEYGMRGGTIGVNPGEDGIVTVNGHVLFTEKDFKNEREGFVSRLVLEKGFNICKKCGATNQFLEDPCPYYLYEITDHGRFEYPTHPCCVCGEDTPIDYDIKDFDPENHYCGGSPRCYP